MDSLSQPGGRRIVCQTRDPLHDPSPILLGQRLDLLGHGALQEDAIAAIALELLEKVSYGTESSSASSEKA